MRKKEEIKKEKGEGRMEKVWRVAVFLASILSTFSFLLSPCSACTGMYAGKGVTVDRSVLIGRTNDFPPCNATMRQQICERGAQVSFGGNTNKYRYVCAPKSTSLHGGRYAGSAANEKGVILTGTITGMTKKEVIEKDPYDPVVDKDVGEPNLPDFLVGNAATAREAVELLASAVAERGHDGAEIYMVADTNEAWYVEVYTGHHWAAVKMPEDKAAVFGNHFNLRGFDTNNAENVMFSPGLFEFAVTNGFAVWTDETPPKLDLYKTFADRSSVEENYANYRAYYGHMRFGDKDLQDYRMDLLPELFFEPGYEIAPTNMFELMRARYEELSDDDLPTPRTNFPIRVIGTVKQGNCHVLQLDCRETTPEHMRGTVWSCLGAAEHGVFHPINAAQDVLPDAYTNDAQRTFGYDPNRAADAFRRLSALTESNRKWYGPGVRNYWRAREARRAVEWPQLVDIAIKTQDAQKLSDYTFDEEERSLAAAKRVYDELLWYAAANNRIRGDGSRATDEPKEAFRPRLRARFAGKRLVEYGGVGVQVGTDEFLDAGFALGDTVDIRFSNGFATNNIPVYDGYYVDLDELLVVCMDDEIRIQKSFGSDLFIDAGLSEPFSVEFTLHKAGGCLEVQTALSLVYSDDRNDYASDEAFANFRTLSGGQLAPNTYFRGASPCDDRHNRASCVDQLVKGAGIDGIIDLADTKEKIDAYYADEELDAPYWKSRVHAEKVHSHYLDANYRAESYRKGIVAALRTIRACDGPCYIHCQEGKDRTGFLCILIESLAGATLDEIERDYMRTYANYYNVDKTTDAVRYQCIREVYFGGIVRFLTGAPSDRWTTENLRAGVEKYLRDGGMGEVEIASLVDKLTGKEGR